MCYRLVVSVFFFSGVVVLLFVCANRILHFDFINVMVVCVCYSVRVHSQINHTISLHWSYPAAVNEMGMKSWWRNRVSTNSLTISILSSYRVVNVFICMSLCMCNFIFFHSRCWCFSFSNLVANSFRDGSTNMWEISIQCMCDDN